MSIGVLGRNAVLVVTCLVGMEARSGAEATKGCSCEFQTRVRGAPASILIDPASTSKIAQG